MTHDISADGKLRRLDPEILRGRVRLPPEHEPVPQDDGGTHALLDRLIRSGLLAEAARLLAYSLPAREAVWWACMCVAHTAPELPTAERKALDAAEAWVRRPDETTRRQAAWAAAAAGYAAPGAWAALGAYWTRGSVSGDARSGRGVETAVVRAAQRDDAGRAADRLHRFFVSAHDIAHGGMGKLPPENPRNQEAPP
jgi:hypothetical protein